MDIKKDDIDEYISNHQNFDPNEIKKALYELYEPQSISDKYVIDQLINHTIADNERKYENYRRRKKQLNYLKTLQLPEQRSVEWYKMRENKLTASSIASALNKCHFTTRDELLLSKLETKPYESNPITEWGVKYEDIAIAFYEELYNVKVLDFGLIPHPTFEAFGASPDGICDDTGNNEYVSRMVEIKCPPKRKFTKTVPPHYSMQVQGQLEVCDLDECDFFQVKIEEYETTKEYTEDTFINDDRVIPGRTELNFPKGVTITYRQKGELKLSYLYPKLGLTFHEYNLWIEENKQKILSDQGEFIESKWWKITRFECTLVKRDNQWWINNIEHILKFYKDLLYYKNNPEKINTLKEKITMRKKKSKVTKAPLNDFMLISSDEE